MNKQSAALLSIVSNSILIIFKLTAGLFMGSISVISEAVHSAIDLLASLIAFFSIKEASKAEDEEHPFGHGKYENVSGFVEAILILFAAIIIIYESVKKLIHGSEIENLGAGIVVMMIAALVNLFISRLLLKTAKKTDSIALEADAMHLLTDVYTSFGVVIGLSIVKLTGLKIVDPITALFVAVLIIKAAIDLTRKSMTDLVDSKLPQEELEKILVILKSHPEIKSYHRLRTRKSGPRREIDLHVQVASSATLVDAHNLCNSVEREIKSLFTESYVVIHAEPEKI